MEPRRLRWDPEVGEVKIPIAESEFLLLECISTDLGISGEWLASQLFRAAIWKFADGVKATGQQWEKDSKSLSRPVFEFHGDLEPSKQTEAR
jgi:hypothetical protein